MRKYFQFTETISGLNYFLRLLFFIVLLIPVMILFFFLVGKEIMASGIDVMDPSSVSVIENDPGLALELLTGTFTTGNIIILILVLLPALWFIWAAIYKRLNALQVRFFPGRVKEVFAFYIIIDFLGLYFNENDTLYWTIAIIGLSLDLFMIFGNSNIKDHKG